MIRFRFVIEIIKVTLPQGERVINSVIPFNFVDQAYSQTDVNKLLLRVNRNYNELKEHFQKGLKKFREALNKFFIQSFEYERIIIGGTFVRTLVNDLELEEDFLLKEMLNTGWLKELINYIGREFKKREKLDNLRYAESVRQLVELLGVEGAQNLLRRNNIKIARSTLAGLCSVIDRPLQIKQLIQEKKVALTDAFEEKKLEKKLIKISQKHIKRF